MRTLVSLLIAGSAALALSPAQAADSTIKAGQRLAATCANCHGTNGVTVTDAFPSLAGMPKESLVASMQAFRNGTRPATVMHQLAKGYTDEQVQLMAAFFAAQRK